MSDFKTSEVRCVQYELAITMEAGRARVWNGLTDQLTSWWLPDFHMLGPDSLITLEPRAGGRLYEQNGDAELLWYTVLAIDPGESLSLSGFCTAEFGGPSTSLLTVRLKDEGTATRLTFSDSLFGRVTDGHASSLRAGWAQLFTDGLKAFVERQH